MSNKYKDVPVEDTKLRFRPSMATDGIIFALFDTDETDQKFYSGEAHILLVKGRVKQGKRKGKARPDLGYWALPEDLLDQKRLYKMQFYVSLLKKLYFKKNFYHHLKKGLWSKTNKNILRTKKRLLEF